MTRSRNPSLIRIRSAGKPKASVSTRYPSALSRGRCYRLQRSSDFPLKHHISDCKQILITGGAGFVGSHLADGLLRAGHGVRILDDLTPQVHLSGVPKYLSRDVELLTGDVRDPQRLKVALAGVDVVFHFSANVGVGQSMYEISRYMSVNTQGTAELLQAILDARLNLEKLVVASSMSIYGEGRYQVRAFPAKFFGKCEPEAA